MLNQESSRSIVANALREAREAKQALANARKLTAKHTNEALVEHLTAVRDDMFGGDDIGANIDLADRHFIGWLAGRLSYLLTPEQIEQFLR